MGCLLRRLAQDVAMINITEASSDDQVNSLWFFRSKSQVHRIIAEKVWLNHLVFEHLLIRLIIIFSTADFNLSSIIDLLAKFTL